jgi:hypothetical protein
MSRRLLLACALALPGCALFLERAPDYAANAMDDAAGRTTSAALDRAESSARGERSGDAEEGSAAEKVTRKLDGDDVLVKTGNDFEVGKAIGGQVLIVKTGQKIDPAGREIIPVRPAKKGDLTVGAEVFFTPAKGDVRRAAWSPGTITDTASAGEGTIGVGPESDIEWDGQVAVKR